MRPLKLIICLGLAFFIVACNSSRVYISGEHASENTKPPPLSSLTYSVFLIGDTGEPSLNSVDPVFRLLKKKAAAAGEQSSIVFLGDNIYPAGMPEKGDPERGKAELRLEQQLDVVKDHPGQLFFTTGNHDWDNGGPGGLQAVKRQEEYIENYLNRGNVFLPDNGFPGPIDIELLDDDNTPFDKDIRLLVIDTEWWLTKYKKSFGDTGEYDLQDAGDFLVELRNIIRERTNDHVLVIGHHPLFSNGSHGGYFPPRTHLLPPVFGTLYVMYRKFFGYPQDIAYHRYQSMKNELMEAFSGVSNLIYASGHDHSLQYFRVDRRRMYQHFLVSGSGSLVDYVAKGRDAEFTYQGNGFMAIRYYNDGSSWLEAWAPDYIRGEETVDGKLLYRIQLASPDEDPFHITTGDSLPTSIPELKDSVVTVPANDDYDRFGSVLRGLLGSHNRELWSVPVRLPVFDIGTVEGGLEAVKLGGRGQSNTLRLENGEGREFVLRSVDKVAGKVWDESLKNTFAEDLAQDQYSIINPYGAFMLPPLAEAVGVYHTNPRLYYIPNDPRLGEFATQVVGELALFEERPDDDMSHAPHFGNSEEVISTRSMLSEVEGDLDHQVDQEMLLRNRMFDIWMSDWDRYEDQWRWASFEPFELDSTLEGEERTEGKIYRPIPRDRDMAFIRMNGVIPTLGKFSVFKHYQDFRGRYGNLKGLTMNSLSLTHRFTNQIDREKWIQVANDVSASLTDETIRQAIAQMPPEIRETAGDEIARVMKTRRDKLPEAAEKYYELVSRTVDVVGSHKKEYVEIQRLDRNRTQVRVYKRSDRDKTKRKAYYSRVFYGNETREIRIYGLGDDDLFELKGESGNAMIIRIIGGSGRDTFTADQLAKEAARDVKLYDTDEGNRWEEVAALDINTDDYSEVNQYDYKEGFKYNTSEPLLFLGHNKDDGLFLGGGATFWRHGFRKYPHASRHQVQANVAARTGAVHIRYNGQFTDIAGSWDGDLDMHILTPNNIRNFLGFGNETQEFIEEDDYYKARLWQYRVAPSLTQHIRTGVEFLIGSFFQVTEVREESGRFITQPQAGVSENTFDDQWYTGVQVQLEMENVDDNRNPKQGFRFFGKGDYNLGIKNTSDNFATIGSSMSIYVSPLLNPQMTLATRIGISHNIGSFPFYKANSLGGVTNLRGLRSTRYNGRTSFYNNVEMRSKLFDISGYLLGGQVGILAYLDHGRVWTDNENSDSWHIGYGGGAWMNIFRMMVVRGSIGFSEDEWNMLLGAGFFF